MIYTYKTRKLDNLENFMSICYQFRWLNVLAMYFEIGKKFLGQFGRGIFRFSGEELRLTLLKLWKSNKKASTRVCCLTEFCKKAA